MLSVKQTIDKYNLIKKGDVIGCAVSGGSDSMALLHYLLSIKHEYGFDLICVNVEHGIRGAESEGDSLFVEKFCAQMGVPFYFLKADAPSYARKNKLNIEEAARNIRYGYFYSLISENICSKIFTAHNQNDNAETVLFNIFRGSGLKGICGMRVDNSKGIIRPMLETPKAEIENYIKQNNIEYKTDSTNNDISYSRNYIRKKLMTLIEKRFNGAAVNIARLSNLVYEETEYIQKLSDSYIVEMGKEMYIKLPCDSVLIKYAAKSCLQKLGCKDIKSVFLQDIASLQFKENGSVINAGGGVNIYREYDRLAFSKSDSGGDKTAIPFCKGTVYIGGYKITVSDADSFDFSGKGAFYIDAEKAGESSVFRFREEGDSFKRYKGGRKSLSDYLTDIKVPKRLRDDLPLLCDDSNVLILFPYDISDDVKIDKNTKKIYKITYGG